jgi:hypothetical protein
MADSGLGLDKAHPPELGDGAGSPGQGTAAVNSWNGRPGVFVEFEQEAESACTGAVLGCFPERIPL